MGTAPLVDQMNVGDPAAGTDAVEFARVVARGAHHGQLYAGEPYFQRHVAAVAARVAELGYGRVAEIVAFLHDTVEDTAITLEMLAVQFPDVIVEAVDAISRRVLPDGTKEPYFAAYVPRVVANRDAAAVKRADAELNLAQCEAEGNSLASRYRRVIAAIDAAHPDLARPPLGR